MNTNKNKIDYFIDYEQYNKVKEIVSWSWTFLDFVEKGH